MNSKKKLKVHTPCKYI